MFKVYFYIFILSILFYFFMLSFFGPLILFSCLNFTNKSYVGNRSIASKITCEQ
jgi:hypothetical protein